MAGCDILSQVFMLMRVHVLRDEKNTQGALNFLLLILSNEFLFTNSTATQPLLHFNGSFQHQPRVKFNPLSLHANDVTLKTVKITNYCSNVNCIYTFNNFRAEATHGVDRNLQNLIKEQLNNR